MKSISFNRESTGRAVRWSGSSGCPHLAVVQVTPGLRLALETCVPGSERAHLLSCCARVTDFLLVCVVMRLQPPIGFSLFPACNAEGRIQAHTGNHPVCPTGRAAWHGCEHASLTPPPPRPCNTARSLSCPADSFSYFILICCLLSWSF